MKLKFDKLFTKTGLVELYYDDYYCSDVLAENINYRSSFLEKEEDKTKRNVNRFLAVIEGEKRDTYIREISIKPIIETITFDEDFYATEAIIPKSTTDSHLRERSADVDFRLVKIDDEGQETQETIPLDSISTPDTRAETKLTATGQDLYYYNIFYNYNNTNLIIKKGTYKLLQSVKGLDDYFSSMLEVPILFNNNNHTILKLAGFFKKTLDWSKKIIGKEEDYLIDVKNKTYKTKLKLIDNSFEKQAIKFIAKDGDVIEYEPDGMQDTIKKILNLYSLNEKGYSSGLNVMNYSFAIGDANDPKSYLVKHPSLPYGTSLSEETTITLNPTISIDVRSSCFELFAFGELCSSSTYSKCIYFPADKGIEDGFYVRTSKTKAIKCYVLVEYKKIISLQALSDVIPDAFTSNDDGDYSYYNIDIRKIDDWLVQQGYDKHEWEVAYY